MLTLIFTQNRLKMMNYYGGVVLGVVNGIVPSMVSYHVYRNLLDIIEFYVPSIQVLAFQKFYIDISLVGEFQPIRSR